jgi:hypothetical protein
VTPKSGGRASKRRDRSPLLPAVVSLETSDIESVVSLTSTGSVRTAIPKPILKKLFGDIERAGGIHEFDKGLNQGLNILLDKGDPSIYGHRGDPQRKRLSNKVTQWKNLKPEKYNRKLALLGLVPAASLPPKAIQRLKPKEKTPPKKQRSVASIPEEIGIESPEVLAPPRFVVDPKVRDRAISGSAVTEQIQEESNTMRGTLHPRTRPLALYRSSLTPCPCLAACFQTRKHNYYS